jgi:hypothetical protein
MTWREALIVRILLIVARMVADDPVTSDELKHLSSHVSVHAPKLEAAA